VKWIRRRNIHSFAGKKHWLALKSAKTVWLQICWRWRLPAKSDRTDYIWEKLPIP